MRIKITAGRGKNYVAELTGTDPTYKYARRFLALAETGVRHNCYVGMETVEDLPEGTLVEVNTGDYRARQTRRFFRVRESALESLSESAVNAEIALRTNSTLTTEV